MTRAVVPSQSDTTVHGIRARSRFLIQSIKLEESGPPGSISGAMMFISALIVAAIVWAMFTNVDEVALAQGEVVPAGSVHSVQHLEGGIVNAILVREGDLVEAETPLIRIAPTATRSDLNQTLVRRASLILQLERLQAFAESRIPEFESMIEGFVDLKNDQQSIFRTQVANRTNQVMVVQSQLNQARGEYQRLINRADSLREQIAFLEEELAIRQRLLDQGLMSRIVFLDTQRELAQAQGSLGETVDSIAETESSIAELNGRAQEVIGRLENEALTQAGELSSELAQVEQALANLTDRVERLDVRSPVRGIVTSLRTLTISSVIQPGEILMEIVPIGDELVVEAKVSPNDIGHVEPGQPADVRVSSYDFSRFGAVSGTVRQISATTFVDEQMMPYYRAVIALDQDFVGDVAGVNPIIPGMTVQADIKTGSKSILDYLLRPVYRGLNSSFRER